MGIATSSIITCDGCKTEMTGEMTFVVLQPQSNGESPFINTTIVVCSVKCFQDYAATLGA